MRREEMKEVMQNVSMALQRLVPRDLGLCVAIFDTDDDDKLKNLAVLTNVEGHVPDLLRGLADESEAGGDGVVSDVPNLS